MMLDVVLLSHDKSHIVHPITSIATARTSYPIGVVKGDNRLRII
jgi:hypothetical protein